MTIQEFTQWLLDPRRRPLVMGVMNLTPDSFSDGGRFNGPTDAAVDEAYAMAEAGADLIDIGGESTRPGSSPVDPNEQLRRVMPIIEALAGATDLTALLSIDTTQAMVAEAALKSGVGIVNDISAGRDDPAIFDLVARTGAAMVLMHMQGTPRTMQRSPTYSDVGQEVIAFLGDRIEAAMTAGIARERLLIDPGIGFGKTIDHNLELLRRMGEFKSLGLPMVIGASRKGFIGTITSEPDAPRRLMGTAASVAWSIANGASVVRVHDVGPMRQVVQMTRAIQCGWPESGA